MSRLGDLALRTPSLRGTGEHMAGARELGDRPDARAGASLGLSVAGGPCAGSQRTDRTPPKPCPRPSNGAPDAIMRHRRVAGLRLSRRGTADTPRAPTDDRRQQDARRTAAQETNEQDGSQMNHAEAPASQGAVAGGHKRRGYSAPGYLQEIVAA